MRKNGVEAVITGRRIEGETHCTYSFFPIRCSCAGLPKEVKECSHGQNVRRMLSPHPLRGHRYTNMTHGPRFAFVAGMSSSILVWTPVDAELWEGPRVAQGVAVGPDCGTNQRTWNPRNHCPHQGQSVDPAHNTTNATTRRPRPCRK